jgi:hypothetical protein
LRDIGQKADHNRRTRVKKPIVVDHNRLMPHSVPTKNARSAWHGVTGFAYADAHAKELDIDPAMIAAAELFERFKRPHGLLPEMRHFHATPFAVSASSFPPDPFSPDIDSRCKDDCLLTVSAF